MNTTRNQMVCTGGSKKWPPEKAKTLGKIRFGKIVK
jgi:hypothetical protein